MERVGSFDFQFQGDENTWQDFHEATGLDRCALGSGLAQLCGAGATMDRAPAGGRARRRAVVRVLEPGKSGARVLHVACGGRYGVGSFVVKVVPAELAHLLDDEERAIREHVVLGILPDFSYTRTGNTIAYRGYDVKGNLKSCFSLFTTTGHIESFIERVYEVLAPWYSRWTHRPDRLVDAFVLDDQVQQALGRLGRRDLFDQWQSLCLEWSRFTPGFVSTTSHGDLNHTNILVSLPAGEASPTPKVIDFARTGACHWATDFARLERCLRFHVACPGDMEAVCEAGDGSFEVDLQAHSGRAGRVLAAIRAVRESAAAHFGRVSLAAAGGVRPTFRKEYLFALAFQQLCLLGSPRWSTTKEVREVLADSTARILKGLLSEARADYVFGYVCYAVDGFERVLVGWEEGRWSFPIGEFCGPGSSMRDTANKALCAFVARTAGVGVQDVLRSGLLSVDVCRILDDGRAPVTVEHTGSPVPVRLWFVKVRVQEPFRVPKQLSWEPKTKLFGRRAECAEAALLAALRRDRIIEEMGRRVLECVDVLVFREVTTEGEGEADVEPAAEFLWLERSDRMGWEYPKGGIEYHETYLEGAARELLEETGLGSLGDFRFGGYLGVQTPDVSNRGKPYDTLRVTGLTFLFVGAEDDITVNQDEHIGHTWVPVQKAHADVWMGSYGKAFLDTWVDQKWRVRRTVSHPISLAFQVTERCLGDCLFCHRRHEGEKPVTGKGMKYVIDLLAERGIRRLTFTGGEPLLLGKKGLFKTIRYANSRRIHTCLSTTGLGPDEEEGLTHDDVLELNGFLDQLLLPVHCVDRAVAGEMYRRPGDWWSRMLATIGRIIEWVDETDIMLEVCTMVSKPNRHHIAEVGQWVLEKAGSWRRRRPQDVIVWRLDAYYQNGEQGATEAERFGLADADLAETYEGVATRFGGSWRAIVGRSAVRRQDAPDVMITPSGGLVTSANNCYERKAGPESILVWPFRNRRRWEEYEECCRTDWEWYQVVDASYAAK